MRSILFQDKTIFWMGLCFLSLAIAALFLPNWIVNNVMFGLARGLAVLGLMLLWRTGLVSFGHALYFGIGAYGVALLEKYTGTTDIFLRLICAVIVSAIVGYLLGFILRGYRAIFFAMLSLAFSMVMYGILVKMEVLGSTDGFSVSRTTFFGWVPESKYALLLSLIIVCMASAAFVQVYLKSSLGQLSTAIKDNEIRVEYLGYSVARAVHVKYVISAIMAGLGGGLIAMALGQVDPDSMVNWTVSGELVFITIMSGAGSVVAPFIGGVVFAFLSTYASEFMPHAWQLVIGATLLGIIFFLPGGIWSLIEKLWKRGERHHG